MSNEQWIRKSGRTLERRRNTRDGGPRFCVSFDDGTRYPTEGDAAVNHLIGNSDYDGVDDVLVRDGQIVGINTVPDGQ